MVELPSIPDALRGLLARGLPAASLPQPLHVVQDGRGVLHSRAAHGRQEKTPVTVTLAELGSARLCDCFSVTKAGGADVARLTSACQDLEQLLREGDEVVAALDTDADSTTGAGDRVSLRVHWDDWHRGHGTTSSLLLRFLQVDNDLAVLQRRDSSRAAALPRREFPVGTDMLVDRCRSRLHAAAAGRHQRLRHPAAHATLRDLAAATLAVDSLPGAGVDRAAALLGISMRALREALRELWLAGERADLDIRRQHFEQNIGRVLLERRRGHREALANLHYVRQLDMVAAPADLLTAGGTVPAGRDSMSRQVTQLWEREVRSSLAALTEELAALTARFARVDGWALCGFGSTVSLDALGPDVAVIATHAGLFHPNAGSVFVLPRTVALLLGKFPDVSNVELDERPSDDELDAVRALWDPRGDAPLDDLAAAYAAAMRI